MYWSAPAQIGLELDSSPLSVRQALDQLLTDAALASLTEEQRGTLWTVLAEVLNNIVEHAYARDTGSIRLNLWPRGPMLAVEVVDHGAPMPGLCLPEGHLAEIGAFDDLPEGGFGWFLIRSMTNNLKYDRVGCENRLRFCLTGD
jgi:serine/threonine-protein kinase RsbW